MVIASHLEAVLARPNCLRAPISGERFQRRGRSGQESQDRFLGGHWHTVVPSLRRYSTKINPAQKEL